METTTARPTTTQPIYNGYSIRQILNNLPKQMHKRHRDEYVKNCLFVYSSEKSKTNLGYSELTRNANHLLIGLYR